MDSASWCDRRGSFWPAEVFQLKSVIADGANGDILRGQYNTEESWREAEENQNNLHHTEKKEHN